ncbi:MAG: 6-phosphogluconolactonase [Acidobacteriaceae bacterium]|nr:6-phosphogluconolactonase [Acidobacteriaceae bacterium]
MPASWTRRSFLATSAATLAATQVPAFASTSTKMLYIGSGAKGPTAGIHVATWNHANGTLAGLRLAAQADSAGFLAASNRGGKRVLFAGHQSAPKVGALSSFSIAANGDLALINTITTPEFDMVHTALDHSQGCLVTASYGSGKVLSVKIAADGHLSAPVSQFHFSGSGPNASRQTSPHAHGVCFSPDNRFVFINDLGTDRIMIYKLNAATAELTPHTPPSFQAAPGSGPRHLAFHPNGKWAYSVNELDSTVTQLAWNAAAGTLTQISSLPTLVAGGDVAANRAGEVIFDTTGRVLYSCNRGNPEELLVLAVDPASGHMTLTQRLPLGGKEARHMTISPDGGFFLVAEQFSDRISVFARDPKTGTLKATENNAPVAIPTCVLFA